MIPNAPYAKAWLSLSPEALWIADYGVTHDGANRVSSWQDLSGHGHDVSQAVAGNQPLWVPAGGMAPYILCNRARGDFLSNATAINLGTAPYTIVAVYRWRSLVGAADYQGLLHNGTSYTNGFSLIQQYGVGPLDALYHWPADYKFPDQAPNTNLACMLIRENGISMLSRKGWVDNSPQAQTPQITPSGALLIGSWGVTTGDVDLYAIAIFKRALTDAECDTCCKLMEQHYGAPSLLSPSLWLRADKGITLDTGKVSAWADQSGNGRDVSHPTPTYRPTFDSVNGEVVFDKSVPQWLFASAEIPVTDQYSLWVVAECAVPSTYEILLSDGGGAIWAGPQNSSPNVFRMSNEGVGAAMVPLASGLHAWEADWDGSTVRVRQDGGTWGTGVAGSVGALAAGLAVGAYNTGGSLPGNARIREVGFRATKLTTAEQAALRAYLAARYGL